MMSELNKFTPGPWIISGRMTKYVEARIGGGLIQEVASCGPTDADGGYGEQQHANALLIAAAPDLLEALEECLPCLGWANDSDEEVQREHELGNGYAELILRARAAIAKARGQS